VAVAVNPDPRFERRGLQILSSANISFHEAILGTRVFVHTVDGGEWVSLRPGTQSGEEVRLPGKGLLSGSGSGRGDVIVRVNVLTPKYPLISISRYFVKCLSRLSKKETTR
jgi:molecular chaperone DnaJ